MSQATSSLTPVMDPYGIPQAVKMLDSMWEKVPEASPLCFFALKLLLNKDKRIMFLSINPKIRALWLKTEMEDTEDYSGDESDDEREKKKILQRMECFNRLFVIASSSILDGHESRCMINFRMSKIVFTSLLRVLETR
ncbi:hypothetical protein Gotur_031002 [Gossypium turneri]